MRLAHTGKTIRHRLTVLSAIKHKALRLPKAKIEVLGTPGILVAVWKTNGKTATIMQSSIKSSLFTCSTLRKNHNGFESFLETDLESTDGQGLLGQFLEAISDWMN